ncbi:hypothetical protein GCM10010411_75430 [Actinomadura fulvescens]|uniref:Uncharacterized protein n=1 Tax=Actinomadura fulvescens TaxID=46160 RepID=A0ABP6CV44_9ACTN
MNEPSWIASVPWPALVIGAWLAAIVVAAVVICKTIKIVVKKAEAQDLPAVLPALTPLIATVTRALFRVPGIGSFPPNDPTAAPLAQGQSPTSATRSSDPDTGAGEVRQ